MSRYVELGVGSDGPLCPLGLTTPLHPAHEQRTAMLDAFYVAAEKDADGDLVGTAGPAYSAAAYENGPTSDRMRLYEHTAATADRHVVVAYWWRCPTCGFVLSAEVKTR